METATISADERGDEVVDGVEQDLVGAAPLGDLGTASQHEDLVAEQEGLVDVMGDEYDRLGEILLDT